MAPQQAEETKDNVYRCEREYGSFYRAVPLSEGVKLEDIKAAFSDGVLEVSVPLPDNSRAKSSSSRARRASGCTRAAVLAEGRGQDAHAKQEPDDGARKFRRTGWNPAR